MATTDTSRTQTAHRGSRVGDRLRQLRVAAGMTQSELAAARSSKEYMSQIERGKTRPTPETVAWLAARLGVDATFLASGVSSDERARAEAVLARAEALTERLDFAGAIDGYAAALGPGVGGGGAGQRGGLLFGGGWAEGGHGGASGGPALLGGH